MGATTESRVFNVLAASLQRRAGGFDLLVRTGTASCTLHFSPSLATGLLVLPRAPGFVRPKAGGRRHANAIPAEMRAHYLAVFTTWRTTPGCTQRAACSEHAVPFNAFQSWLCDHRAECEAELEASRTPVTKPGGRLL